ncbi:hypothetical protein GC163_01215 [bacterium]|nr:hypothetical protein [bacterium]
MAGSGAGQRYEIELTFNTQLPADSADLYALAKINSAGSHAYSTTPYSLNLKASDASPKEWNVQVNGASGTNHVGDTHYRNTASVKLDLTGLDDLVSKSVAIVVRRGAEELAVSKLTTAAQSIDVPLGREGISTLQIGLWQGNREIPNSSPKNLTFSILKEGPRVRDIDARPFLFSPDGNTVFVFFHDPDSLDNNTVNSGFELRTSDDNFTKGSAITGRWDTDLKAAVLTINGATAPGRYQIVLKANVVKDKAGNSAQQFSEYLERVPDATTPTIQKGVRSTGAEYIRYPEYTEPRPQIDGFNPSDKVITRVARLYYFRDAHRVAQIVNRKARSYNRAAVEMTQQLADKSRTIADADTDARQQVEARAVRSAQQAREAETTLRSQQEALIKAKSQTSLIQAELDRVNQDIFDKNVILQDLQTSLNGLKGQLDSVAGQIVTNDSAITVKSSELETLRAAVQPDQAAIQAAETQLAELMTKKTNLNQQQANITQQIATTETTYKGNQNELNRQQIVAATVQSQVSKADAQVVGLEGNVNSLLSQVATYRRAEMEATEQWEDAERKEQRSREEQFRREVAAAHEDPDTFAPGKPKSEDPVEQVSISVVGEGLIQLRGPRKGVNIVHTMINELDAPVGQVRVAVHTVQINGEHGDRMEKVAERIQRYIDHSRFLTTQSAQYLRNAVVIVASRKAEESQVMYGDCPPDVRDVKYREAFFGKDFLDELREIDSEFLRSDNKVLSLHSMDTTSLASALFLLALAKNDTRQEILLKFDELVQGQLPYDEKQYFKASAAKKWVNFKPFHFSGDNAKFVSLHGCFENEVGQPDTLNPCQREFIRLAQIFKARLVTEIELRQRVMERALIEERIGNVDDELKASRDREKAAEELLNSVTTTRQQALRAVMQSFVQTAAETDATIPVVLSDNLSIGLANNYNSEKKEDFINKLMKDSKLEFNQRKASVIFETIGPNDAMQRYTTPPSCANQNRNTNSNDMKTNNNISLHSYKLTFPDKRDESAWNEHFDSALDKVFELEKHISKFNLSSEAERKYRAEECYLNYAHTFQDDELSHRSLGRVFTVAILQKVLSEINDEILSGIAQYKIQSATIVDRLSKPNADIPSLYREWLILRRDILASIKDESTNQNLEQLFQRVDKAFQSILNADVDVRVAQDAARQSRRRLDHKKFLDMLVDDVEEKLIELIEGTRAHTANVDNYVKRIATALEDDFNTQFYYPTFKYVRETSQYWDVQVGQVETTSILSNNRSFAKVSPQATMEFDLPKRDILINEAFESALAAYNDYGALLADPQFLALAKMYGGQPASQTYGGGLPAPMVRDVLPGLPSQTDADFISQSENNVPQIGANLEALIPDPAVYKFETGTGYEIRPVIQPDGQAVVFHLNYMYSTNIREPVRADEKHLGRIKRHFIDTDVQLGNYELREVSRYTVALKASRTARGVPLLEDVPVAGLLFRPLPQQESSLQQNLILAQSVIYPTLFDLMGLRWAPAVADLGSPSLQEREFVTRNREKFLRNEVFDYSSLQVDDFMRVPEGERRGDLYRTQEAIPVEHPNGYLGKGLNINRGELQEGYDPRYRYLGTPATSAPVEMTPNRPSVFEGSWNNGSTLLQPTSPTHSNLTTPERSAQEQATPQAPDTALPARISTPAAPLPQPPNDPIPPSPAEAANRLRNFQPPRLDEPEIGSRSVIIPMKGELPAPNKGAPPPPSRPRLLTPSASPSAPSAAPMPLSHHRDDDSATVQPVKQSKPIAVEPAARLKALFHLGRKSGDQ